MTRVLEVAAAEDVTGHPYSLAVTSPEGATFVKGTCREETRWWTDVLQVYSRNKGRHKRNATFPGGQTTILQVTPTIRSNTPNPPRPRFNSCRSEPRSSAWIPEAGGASDLCSSVFSSTSSLVTTSSVATASNNVLTNGNAESTSEVNLSRSNLSSLRPGAPLENGSAGNYLGTTTSSTTSLNGNVCGTTVYSTAPTAVATLTTTTTTTSSIVSLIDKPPMIPNDSTRSTANYRDQPVSSASPPTRDKLRAEDKARRRMNQQGERTGSIIGDTAGTASGEKLDDDTCRRILLEHEREREGKLRDIAASLTQPRVRRIKPRTSEPTRDVVDAVNSHQDKLIRGDPDGCGLDISGIRYSPTSELRVDLPAEDLLNIKKGWLMKQGLNKEWNKHWFVLRGCGLMYYRDPCAEDKGIMDGVIDLNTVTAVTSLQVARNYGFQTVAWDDRGSTVLSAVTAGIRSSWMSAIRRAANLPDPDSNVDSLAVCPDTQQEPNPQSPTTSIADRERDSVVPSASITPRSVLFSSDEEYRTASEGGRRESGDWSEMPVSPPLVRNGDWPIAMKGSGWSDTTNHEWSELPPSPPLTRTALSRVKARSRSSSRSRVYKRSRSSPPSSRRSTLDSVRSEDLMMACCELELSRLRQQKAEASIREKQVEELLSTIQRTEQQRSKDLDDLEKMKKMYSREKEMLECKLLETEAILRETTERCEMLTNELTSSHRSVEHLQAEVTALGDRLSQGKWTFFSSYCDVIIFLFSIEENERLYNKVRELEKGGLSASRERGRSFDSLSDLTNIELDLDLTALDKERIMEEYDELRNRFEKAVMEIRAMRRELREAHATQDVLELEIFAHKQDAASVSETNQAQIQLMAARIQDLTNKLAASEKQVRTLKQKLTKAESRDKRRSLSLKGRESFQISQEVEDKLDAEKDSSECSEVSGSSEISLEVMARLKKLERVVSKSKRRLEKCLGSTQAEDKAEKCLRDVNEILDSCLECKKNQASAQVTESVGVVVSRVETILKDKLSELTRRRQLLAQEGRLDEREKMKLVAERIAFESVILRQIKCALNRTTDNKSAVLSELVETSQLASSLKRKIHGTKPKTYQNTSYIQYLTKVLANKLVLIGGHAAAASTMITETPKEINAARSESLNFLLQKQREINDLVQKYQDTKLRQLAEALAAETLSLSEQEDLAGKQIASSGKKLLEDRRIREAWALAQETVSKELVQAEVSHVIMRYGQLYEQNVTSIADACLSFDSADNVKLESWIDAAQARLRQELELSVHELSETYEECLRVMKRNKSITTIDPKHESRQLLTDYVDVIAHKALIDSRIALLQETTRQSGTIFYGETFVSSLIRNEEILSCLANDEGWDFQSNSILDAEYSYLYQRLSKECEDRVTGKWESKEQLKSVSQSLFHLEEDLAELSKCMRDRTGRNDGVIWSKSTGSMTDWPGVCEKCLHLREQIRKLSDYMSKASCQTCSQLQETIQRITTEHNRELEMLKRNQERDLMDIKGELDSQRQSLTTQYEHEAASLRERARKLEHRLNAMDSEHSAHVNELRAAYQRSISAELDTDAETRKRYKEEIKQLRALCEKGLLAMENSHRRIIAEMEEKHRQELENLRVEKEQALSEETQATLAALDAMRKAHEHEVQKEIAKFKQEFIKQMQAREDIGVLHKEHEEEMEEIKQEILSLSAKYSSKCVESAALEEKVGNLSKQLAQAQQHIMQLDARNKQLRAHLVLETNDTANTGDAMQILRCRDNDLVEPREEMHRLQQQFKHGDTPRESSGVLSKAVPLLDYSPAYSPTRPRCSQVAGESRLTGERNPRTASLRSGVLQKPSPLADRPQSAFSYRLERVKSVSLPYSSSLARPASSAGVPGSHVDEKQASLEQKGQERNNSNLGSSLWDSLRPRSGLPHQYQGSTTATEMRVGGGAGGQRWQEAGKQNEKHQLPEAYTLRADARRASRLTPEPAALSVAELMRSPPVRWSSRSCRSLPPTPTPSYHHPLHPPLPAMGMVAERKKRFEL
ncbi:Protein outspread [Ooceraea biroi]|uniref:Protein outspread n=1 Tax=Ooceraea biroi TaxID=2015173 RepID=A0A026WUU2_OOCBI|nr:Protein outspread [Ooceraea biroi]